MARSGDLILDSLWNNAITTELVPTRMPQLRIGLLFSVIAADWEGWEKVLDNYKNEGFLETATLADNIVKLAAPFYARSLARASDVIMRFVWEQNADRTDDAVIPFGTIIQTVDTPPIQYSTVERVILYKTAELVTVRARSLETGAQTKVAAYSLDQIESDITGVTCYNPQPSWGGKDAEALESVRTNAMSARYTQEKGTTDHIRLTLINSGLTTPEFCVLEHAFGYGSFAVFIDTASDEQMREIEDLIADSRAAGIYTECGQAVHVGGEITIIIKVINSTQLTPKEYNALKSDVEAAVLEYIEQNGVGNKLYLSKLSYYLLQQFKDRDLYDSTITIATDAIQDIEGNVDLQPYEVLEVTKINLEIDVDIG